MFTYKKKYFFSSFLILFFLLGFFFFHNNENIKGATYGWIQSSWIGGITTNMATHTDNQENWNQFASKDDNITVTPEGEVTIEQSQDIWVTTNDEDWNEGVDDGFYVSEGIIYPLKPPGASCTNNAECLSLTCSNTCLFLCDENTSSGQMCGFNGFAYIPLTANDGKVWLDRNLGATQVATATNDSLSYGHYYQWGRGSDGHQLTTSTLVSILSNSDTPGHSSFILAPNSPYDWRSPQNNNLWQGVNGTNNPCPPGFRLPTSTEWQSLVTAEGITNGASAFASSLKLPYSGYRGSSSISERGSSGYYWSSSVIYSDALGLGFASSSVNPSNSFLRFYGITVRCIKN